MKKSFVTALAVALLGVTTLGAVASSASAPHKPVKNIVQTAVAAGSFKTLVSLVKQAGLAGAHPSSSGRRSGGALRGGLYPPRRVVSLVAGSPILGQTGNERARGDARSACVEPGLTRSDR